MARKSLTDRMVGRLKPGAKRRTIPDPDMRGHYVRIAPSGAKSFVAVARNPDGKQIWATIGAADVIKITEARDVARDAIKRIRAGLDPFETPPAKPDTFQAVAESYLERHVKARGLRSQAEIESVLSRQILPAWADRPFVDIRRGDVALLMDQVEDANGPRAADKVLAVVRQVMNWHATRIDDYLPPLARGMRRVDAKGKARARVLGDDELRIVWTEAEASGTFGAVVRLALLTAQRRTKVATMKWEDVTIDGAWTIAAEDREKGNGGVLILPEPALAIIRAQHRLGDNPYVFPGRGNGHFKGWSPCKRAFDMLRVTRQAVEQAGSNPDSVEPLAPWTIHDLRRTARSLMARAGVRPDVAERVMGHAIQGVEGIYDRHHYREEKAAALRHLAGLIARIVHPSENVVQLERPS